MLFFLLMNTGRPLSFFSCPWWTRNNLSSSAVPFSTASNVSSTRTTWDRSKLYQHFSLPLQMVRSDLCRRYIRVWLYHLSSKGKSMDWYSAARDQKCNCSELVRHLPYCNNTGQKILAFLCCFKPIHWVLSHTYKTKPQVTHLFYSLNHISSMWSIQPVFWLWEKINTTYCWNVNSNWMTSLHQ